MQISRQDPTDDNGSETFMISSSASPAYLLILLTVQPNLNDTDNDMETLKTLSLIPYCLVHDSKHFIATRH